MAQHLMITSNDYEQVAQHEGTRRRQGNAEAHSVHFSSTTCRRHLFSKDISSVPTACVKTLHQISEINNDLGV